MRSPRLALALLLAAHASLATARVRVVDESGNPVPAAVVRHEGGETTVRADGWAALPEGAAAACVMAPGFVAAVPQGSGDVVVTLRRAAILSGSVLTPQGRPAVGVSLARADVGPMACAPMATTDKAGGFVLDGLPAGTARVSISTPDGFLAPRANVAARAGGRLDLVVLPAATVAFSVAGADAKPLPGATLRALPRWDLIELPVPLEVAARKALDEHEATTDASGRAVLPPLPRASGWRIAVRHPAHAAASVLLDLRTAAPSPMMRLRQGGSILLRATDEVGAPRASVMARLTSASATDADLVTMPPPADASGVVRIARVPAGKYELELRAPGAAPRLLRNVVVRDGEATLLGDIAMGAGVALRGVVLADGAPVAGAEVTLWTAAAGARLKLTATSDSDGRFAFEGLEPGEVAALRARADGFVGDRLSDVATDETDVVLSLRRAATLVVHARDAATQEPVAGLEVRGRDLAETATPDPERPDDWIVPGLRPGVMDLLVKAPGYVGEARRGIELVSGKETLVAFELLPGEVVNGRVVEEETGAAIAAAWVGVPSQGVDTRTATDGRFTLQDVRVPFDLAVRDEEHVSEHLPGVDAAALAAGLAVTMGRGASVEGMVLSPSGAPLAGAAVTEEEAGKVALSTPDGWYRLNGLKPGPTRLRKTDARGTLTGLESATVQLAKGTVTRHDFGASRRLTGIVTLRGEPVRGVGVGLMRSSDGAAGHPQPRYAISAAQTDADGRYSLGVAEAGTHCLNVTWRGRRFARLVSVPEGVPLVTEDIELPELTVSGRVVDAATRRPLRGVQVTLTPKAGRPAGSSSISMSEGEEDAAGMLRLVSTPQSSALTDGEGAFILVVAQPGAASLAAWLPGYEYWHAPEELVVTDALSDLEIAMTEEGATKDLHVTLLDATTGDQLVGTIIVSTTEDGDGQGSTMTMSGSTTGKTRAPGEGETARVVGWAAGRGIGVRAGIRPTGEHVKLDLALVPGGSLRVLVPEGALQPDAMRGYVGGLGLRIPPALDLGPADVNLQMNVTAKLVSQLAPGEWLFKDLPAGPLILTLGDGPEQLVEIIAGQVVEADLR